MQPINLRSFKAKSEKNKKAFKKFLGKVEKNIPKGINAMVDKVNTEVWEEIDCLSCANCCKKMTPTFTASDIKRIAAHFKLTPEAFKEKWLYKDDIGDWNNKKQPCQFLNLKDNKCSIYEIRPIDCSGFPHLNRKKVVNYIHVHQQNIEYCPATYRMVEKWMVELAQ